jgi:flagellar L-ring protein precursor FlgH
VSACGAVDRIANIGKSPDFSPIGTEIAERAQKPVSMPMPEPQIAHSEPNSLWRTGARSFFKDQRASNVGDILTVLVAIDDTVDMKNETNRTRDNSESADLTKLFGQELRLLPPNADPTNLTDLGSKSGSKGTGTISRNEKIEMRVAATIAQVLPNGNFFLQGRQEVRVNNEVRELLVAGIIRPEDISSGNTVNYDQIAEARISYGGRGQLTDVQQPRYGQQLYDILFPF